MAQQHADKGKGQHGTEGALAGASGQEGIVRLVDLLQHQAQDPERLRALIEEGARLGLIGAPDVLVLERFMTGRLTSRPVDERVLNELRPDTGYAEPTAQLSFELPRFIQDAGMSAAAMGPYVVTTPGTIAETEGIGLDILAHELTHVASHIEAGTPTAIHYEDGDGEQETAPRRAGRRTETRRQRTDREVHATHRAHRAEIRRIVRHLEEGDDLLQPLAIMSHWPAEVITSAWRVIFRSYTHRCYPRIFIERMEEQIIRQYARECVAMFTAVSGEWRLRRIIELTSTGIFNPVSQADALIAFALTQGLTAEEQHQFYRHNGGEHYRRMYRQLPEDARQLMRSRISREEEQQLWAQERQRREDAAEERQQSGRSGGEGSEERRREFDARRDFILQQLRTGFLNGVDRDEAMRVLNTFRNTLGVDPSGALLRALVRELDPSGHIDQWIEAMPEADRYSRGNVRVFLHVLRARPPESALGMLTRLLSTGIFNGVSEEEARLAWELVRVQPADVRRRFRESAHGEFLRRMERSLNVDLVLGTQLQTLGEDEQQDDGSTTAAGMTQGALGTSDTDAQRDLLRRADAALLEGGEGGPMATLRTHVEAMRRDDGERNCQRLFGMLAGQTAMLRIAMVRRLDALGLVDTLLDHLGNDFLWAEERRATTLGILSARDPARSVRRLRDLLNESDFWIIPMDRVDSNEALLAHMLLRAMTPEDRQRILERNPDWQSLISTGMTRSQQFDRSTSYYNGGEGESDRASILSQLAERSLWAADTPEGQRQLGNVVRMAVAANLGRQLHRYAREYDGWSNHQTLLESVGLQNTEEYTPIRTEEGGDGPGWLGVLGAGTLTEDADESGTVGMNNVLLDRVQDGVGMDNQISGIEFQRFGSDEERAGRNSANVSLDPSNGRLEVHIPVGLAIQRVSYPYGDITVQTGAIETGPIRINLTYRTGDNPNNFSDLQVHVAEATLNDVVVVMVDNMVAVDQVTMREILLRISELPFDPRTLRDDAAAQTQLQSMVHTNDLIPTRHIGAFFNRTAISDQLTAGFSSPELSGPGGVHASVGEIQLQGITTSGGQRADNVTVRDISFDQARTRSAHLRNVQRQLETRIAAHEGRLNELGESPAREIDQREAARLRTEIEGFRGELARIAEELPQAQEQDRELVALYRRQRGGETLSPTELARLEELQSNVQVGATLSVGSMSATGVALTPGGEAGSLSVSGIYGRVDGEVSGDTATQAGFGMMANPLLLTRAATGQGGIEGSGSLDIDRVSGSNLEMPGSVPELRPLVERYDALNSREPDQLSEDERTRLLSLTQQFQQRVCDDPEMTYLTAARRLLEIGDPSGIEQQQEAQRLRRMLARVGRIRVHSVDVRGIHLEGEGEQSGDRTTGSGSARIADVAIEGVQVGQDTRIGSVEGQNIRGTASFTELVGREQEGERSGSGTLRADRLVARDITSGQTHVDEVELTGARASAGTAAGGHASAGFQSLNVRGVTQSGRLERVTQELAQLEAVPEGERTPLQQERMNELLAEQALHTTLVWEIQHTESEITRLQEVARTGRGRARSQARRDVRRLTGELEELRRREALWHERRDLGDTTLTDVQVAATGLGNVLEEGHDFSGREISIAVHVGGAQTGAWAVPLAEGRRLSFQALTAQTFDVRLRIMPERVRDEASGDESWTIRPIAIDEIHLIDATLTGMNFEMPVEGELIEVSVPTGHIAGLHGRDIPLADMDPATMSGHLQVAEFSATMEARMGNYFRAGGTLAARDVHLDAPAAGEGGEVALDVRGGYTLSNIGLDVGSPPPGSLAARLAGIGATIRRARGNSLRATLNRETGEAAFETELRDFNVTRLNYQGDGQSLELRGGATFTGVTVRASAHVNMQAGEGESAVSRIRIQLLRVNEAQVRNLHYERGTTVVDMSRANLTVLEVRDYDVDTGTYDLRLQDGSLSAHVVTEALDMHASAHVGGLRFQQLTNGRRQIRFDDLDASAGGTHRSTDEDGQETSTFFSASIRDANTGQEENDAIIMDRQGIVIPNLTIPMVELRQINYHSPSFHVDTRGRSQLQNVNVHCTLHANTSEAEDAPPYHQIEIHSLRVPTTTLRGLELSKQPGEGSSGWQISFPDRPVVLSGFRMSGFVIDFNRDTGALEGLDMREAHLQSALIPRLRSGMSGYLARDISAEGIDITGLRYRGEVLNIDGIDVEQLQATFGGVGDITIRSLGAGGVRYSEQDGATVMHAHTAFRYESSDHNIIIDFPRINLPDGLHYRPDGTVNVPEANFRNVEIQLLNLETMMSGSTSSSGRSSPGGMADDNYLDTLQGNISAHVSHPAGSTPLNVPINNGAISFEQLEANLPTLQGQALRFRLDDGQNPALLKVEASGGWLATAGAVVGGVLLGPGGAVAGAGLGEAAARYWWLVQWNLGNRAGRDHRTAQGGDIRLVRLFEAQVNSDVTDMFPSGGSGPPSVQITGVDAHLWMQGPARINLRGGQHIILGRAAGNGVVLNARGDCNARGLDLVLNPVDHAEVQNVQLPSNLNLDIGHIEIGGTRDMHLTFGAPRGAITWMPHDLTGYIISGTLRNLNLRPRGGGSGGSSGGGGGG